ncbi:MAG: hypothetical protein ACREXK_11550 [Gammaproteobacteria bacterium]
MTDPASNLARPATVEDLKLLLRALDEHGVDYVLIGGYTLYALGYRVPVRTLDIEGLLKTKQTLREKDKLDRDILERALGELKR